VPTFTIALDKSDASYTGYDLANDRDTCVAGLEKGGNWGIESLDLENEPAKNSTDPGRLKVKSIKLLAYPNTTKGHQDTGVYKYFVDSPTRGTAPRTGCGSTTARPRSPSKNTTGATTGLRSTRSSSPSKCPRR
jgi:hypothetical protein